MDRRDQHIIQPDLQYFTDHSSKYLFG